MMAFTSSVLSNLGLAAVLAAGVWLVTRWWRNPQAAHALWLLVLAKLITPPFAPLPVPSVSATQFMSEAIEDSASGWNEAAPVAGAFERLPIDPGALQAAESSQATEQGFAAGIFPSEPVALPLEAMEDENTQHDELGSPRDHAIARLADDSLEFDAFANEEEAAETLPPTGHSIGMFRSFGLEMLGYVWLVASVLCASVLAFRCLAFRRMLGACVDADDELSRLVARLTERLRLKRPPRVQLVDAQLPPLVWSLGLRPRVILPAQLLSELSLAQRETVIAHELAHIKRRDHLVRWLEVLVLVPFWWYPVVWLARRKLHEAEEEACDAWVVWALPAERRSYGEAMLRTIEFLTDSRRIPAVAGSALGRSFYQRRIHMILKQNIHRRMSWTACLGVGLLAATVLPLAAQTQSLTPATPAPPVPAAAPAPPAQPEQPPASNPFAAAPAPADATQGTTPAPAADRAAPPSAGLAPPVPPVQVQGADAKAVSNEELLSRIERLERMIERLAASGAGRENNDFSYETNSDAPKAAKTRAKTIEPDAAPYGLTNEADASFQLEMAELDAEAARKAFDAAQHALRMAQEANEMTLGAYTATELSRLQADAEMKAIELKRAQAKFRMLYRKLKGERKGDSAEHDLFGNPDSLQQLAKMQQAQAEQQVAMQRHAAELQEAMQNLANQRAQFAEQQARLQAELDRVRQLAEERPVDAETRTAIEEFLKRYLKMSDEEAKAAAERME